VERKIQNEQKIRQPDFSIFQISNNTHKIQQTSQNNSAGEAGAIIFVVITSYFCIFGNLKNRKIWLAYFWQILNFLAFGQCRRPPTKPPA
jgi:hypothetical protein